MRPTTQDHYNYVSLEEFLASPDSLLAEGMWFYLGRNHNARHYRQWAVNVADRDQTFERVYIVSDRGSK